MIQVVNCMNSMRWDGRMVCSDIPRAATMYTKTMNIQMNAVVNEGRW